MTIKRRIVVLPLLAMIVMATIGVIGVAALLGQRGLSNGATPGTGNGAGGTGTGVGGGGGGVGSYGHVTIRSHMPPMAANVVPPMAYGPTMLP